MSDRPVQQQFLYVTDAQMEELDRLGTAIYAKLKPHIEPAYDRQFITIHVDTEDYAIGKNSSSATRAILERHPLDGRLYCRKIGNEPEYGLAARLLASEMREAHNK